MGYGQIIGRDAMNMGIDKVKDSGAAIVGLRNVHHLGRIGAWVKCVPVQALFQFTM